MNIKIISCVEVTAEDVEAVPNVGIHCYKDVEMFNIKYKKLPKLAKMIILGTLIYFGSYHVCFTLKLQPVMVLCNWFIIGNTMVILQQMFCQ